MMRTKTASSPTLRFLSFEEAWKTKRLGDLCSTFKSGSGITSSKIADKGDFPVYGGNGLRGYTDTFTHEGFYFLIGRQGALCGNINRVQDRSFVSEHAIAVQGNAATDTEWLAQRLDYFNLNRLSESSAQPGLSVGKLASLKLVIPTLPEQKKIADFLTAVDKRIGQLTQKKALLEDYKKGAMQQLFSQAIRFKDDEGKDFPDWEEKTYSEVYTFKNTNSYSRDLLNYESGSVRNIHYGDIHKKFRSNFWLSEEEVPYINAALDLSRINEENYCKVGDLVIADASEDYADVGKCIEIRDLNGERTLAGLHTMIARPRSGTMAPGFGGYLMQCRQIRLKIMTIAQGTKVLGLSKPQLSKLTLPIPHYAEQSKIADFLSALDRKIESVATQIRETQTFKRGLLQQMFV